MPPPDIGARANIPLPVWPLLAFVVIALLLQLPLLSNPGYFSHDELQWAARADVAPGTALPWLSWWDWRTFQYRPLTFNLWLLISRALFRTPALFHALWVGIGIGNGLLLLRLLQRLPIRAVVALVFALGFTLGPFAAYTHGWVATLADLLWVGFGLILAQALLWAGNDPARHGPACVLALVLTILALLAKEAAIVLPALLLLAWLLDGRRKIWRDAALASALPVLVYLALRLPVILYAPRAEGVYGWSLVSIPKQWLMYQLYPLAPSVFEIQQLWLRSPLHLLLAGMFCLAVLLSVFRASVRAGLWLLIGAALALGPVLLLRIGADHYGYAYAALTMAALAAAWPGLRRGGRVLAIVFVVVGTWHGLNVQREIHHIGELQARFSPALAQALDTPGHVPLRLRLPGHSDWAYRRFTHEIPSYLGVPIGDRVQWVPEGTAADYVIAADGSLAKP